MKQCQRKNQEINYFKQFQVRTKYFNEMNAYMLAHILVPARVDFSGKVYVSRRVAANIAAEWTFLF